MLRRKKERLKDDLYSVRSIGAVVICVINTKVSKVNIYYNKLITNIIVKKRGRRRGKC
jgi:hypothetical protein